MYNKNPAPLSTRKSAGRRFAWRASAQNLQPQAILLQPRTGRSKGHFQAGNTGLPLDDPPQIIFQGVQQNFFQKKFETWRTDGARVSAIVLQETKIFFKNSSPKVKCGLCDRETFVCVIRIFFSEVISCRPLHR